MKHKISNYRRGAIALLIAATIFALPWTPLWTVVLIIGYVPTLCLLGVDHWFQASETLTLSGGTEAELADSDNPIRQKEIARLKWLCATYNHSSDWMLWADDPGEGPVVRIRAKAWGPIYARDLVENVIDKYKSGEGPDVNE